MPPGMAVRSLEVSKRGMTNARADGWSWVLGASPRMTRWWLKRLLANQFCNFNHHLNHTRFKQSITLTYRRFFLFAYGFSPARNMRRIGVPPKPKAWRSPLIR